MLTSLFLQTQTPAPQLNVIQAIFDGVADNPSSVILAVSLIVFLLATRAMLNELRESRKMLDGVLQNMRESQKLDGEQETKTLDMARLAIEKFDRVAASIDNFADAQRSSSTKYFESTERIATSHVETTTLLVNRITAMEEKRSEDEIYANEALHRQVNDQLMHSQEIVGAIVGNILLEARVLHQETRKAVNDNNQVLMTALLSTPPASPPTGEAKPEPDADAHGG